MKCDKHGMVCMDRCVMCLIEDYNKLYKVAEEAKAILTEDYYDIHGTGCTCRVCELLKQFKEIK